MADPNVFPITPEESDRLSHLGWNSGIGWENQFDWFWVPSAGHYEFVEERDDLMQRFLSDLQGVRRDIELAVIKGRLCEAAQDVLDVLMECRDYFDSRADAEYFPDSPYPRTNEEMDRLTDIDAVLKRLGVKTQPEQPNPASGDQLETNPQR